MSISFFFIFLLFWFIMGTNEHRKADTKMRIMGVDYGDARTGIAMSDLLCSIVGTTTVIHSRRDDKTIAEIQKLIAQNGITEIVVGCVLVVGIFIWVFDFVAQIGIDALISVFH